MPSQDVPVYCFENCVAMLVLEYHVIGGRGNNLDEMSKLNHFHHQLLQFVEEDTDNLRKSNCLNIMPKLKHITQTISFIRNCNLEIDRDCLTEHLKALNSNIAFLVTESANKEALQAIVLLGGIECVCDLLVIIVSKLYPTFDCKESKLLRQYIAVALTNLSYKNSWIKEQICTYPGLVVSIRAIIPDCPVISKVYSSLIRNLSWKSTGRSIDKLCETIGPLVTATSLCYQKKDTKGLLCCLGALWNLSNHSTEAHRFMCAEDHCLELLITLLKLNINYATIMEAITGILRSLSKYIVTNSVVMAFVETHNILPYLMKVCCPEYVVIVEKGGKLEYLKNLETTPYVTIIQNASSTVYNLVKKSTLFQRLLLDGTKEIEIVQRLRKCHNLHVRAKMQGLFGMMEQVYNNPDSRISNATPNSYIYTRPLSDHLYPTTPAYTFTPIQPPTNLNALYYYNEDGRSEGETFNPNLGGENILTESVKCDDVESYLSCDLTIPSEFDDDEKYSIISRQTKTCPNSPVSQSEIPDSPTKVMSTKKYQR